MSQRNDPHRIELEELEELFADLWQVPGFVGRRHGFRPHVDCFRSEEPPTVTMIVELAGIDPADVEINVSERTVTIAGQRRRPAQDCKVSWRQLEIEYGRFQRRFALTEDVDPDRAEATYDRGLLTVVLPLAEKPRAGRVTIVIDRRGA
jgi:HSP20 family molecular chaperone IbpA